MAKILVIDDERSIRNAIKEILEFEKYEVTLASDGFEGISMIEQSEFDVILCDVKMPGKDGMEVLHEAMKLTETPFIVISGHGTIELAVEAIKKGAYDYIAKPLDLNRLLIALRNAMEKGKLEVETKKLRKKVSNKYNMIGESDSMKQLRILIDKVAPTQARVFITGENGTGKELVARAIYEASNRSKAPFVEVNCAAIPSELIESQLFGHEKGSFTSAVKQRKGDFELANGGTLFLDEIGDMSLSAQAKVLRALQENKIVRVGGEKDIPVDVRIIAATNKKIKEEIAKNNFREDLYHRLSVILIEVPPLRERKEDIPLLVDYFLTDIAEAQRKKKTEISDKAIVALQEKFWSGNIRELRNVVERLVILAGSKIEVKDIENYV
ncbi:MAG: sigma-54-dependent Fis family transcriptional regulator [Bacteroidetes bacterium]|nr:MAG: sigma-54-dependent Fis family transcriptional regulator [Bacteroidota bacterium]